MNKETDAGYDEQHHRRYGIDEEREVDVKITRVDPRKERDSRGLRWQLQKGAKGDQERGQYGSGADETRRLLLVVLLPGRRAGIPEAGTRAPAKSNQSWSGQMRGQK